MKNSKITLKRPPVIAVMGHVDHGKTTFLDSIRDANVTAGEAGGITQNTRAHEVVFGGQKMTFIDTPGHEAFSEMRSRGAKVTDIVLLVVAADDGVQPQTKESIKYAKAAGVPLVVAINKTDIPGITTDKIKNQLSQNDVLVEEYGGDVQIFPISALKKEGLDELLEGLLLQAEMLEIAPAKPTHGNAECVVLEARLDRNLGPIALCLLKAGNISVGEWVVREGHVSKIRAIMDEHHKVIDQAHESQPVWIAGIDEVLATGASFYIELDEKKAEVLAKSLIVEKEVIVQKEAEEMSEEDELTALAGMLAQEQIEEEIKKFNVVVRTDTQGTLEAVEAELAKLNDEQVQVNILSKGTGDVTRKDILTAKNGHGIVLGFQVAVPSDLQPIVKQEKVLVRTYSVIYEMIDEVAEAMDSMLDPEFVEEEVAKALIKKVFVLSNNTKVCGSVVLSGKVIKGYKAKVMRGDVEIARGKIVSLRRGKEEVKEIQKGVECGIVLEPQGEFEEDDQVVLFKLVTQ